IRPVVPQHLPSLPTRRSSDLVAYRRRALPVVWTWMRSKKGHSSGRKQQALLAYVHRLMPAHVPVVVTGDSEFTPLQALLEQWGRSEEHTSELQSRENLVCRLL